MVIGFISFVISQNGKCFLNLPHFSIAAFLLHFSTLMKRNILLVKSITTQAQTIWCALLLNKDINKRGPLTAGYPGCFEIMIVFTTVFLLHRFLLKSRLMAAHCGSIQKTITLCSDKAQFNIICKARLITDLLIFIPSILLHTNAMHSVHRHPGYAAKCVLLMRTVIHL